MKSVKKRNIVKKYLFLKKNRDFEWWAWKNRSNHIYMAVRFRAWPGHTSFTHTYMQSAGRRDTSGGRAERRRH